MALENGLEEILSDDYEEGEVLEEDSLYDDISSLEEFSFDEVKKSEDLVVVDLTGDDNPVPLKRRKEHKCKEGSICRKERKGKHCYARIRKDRQPSSTYVDEVLDAPVIDKTFRKPDSNEKKHCDRHRVTSPVRSRSDYDKTYRREYSPYYRDGREKENRLSYRRNQTSSAKSPRNRPRYTERKPYRRRSRSREVRPKHSNSTVLSSSQKNIDETQVNNKTSLLKRLVGSGSSGLKTVKDYDSGNNSGPSDGEIVEPNDHSGHLITTQIKQIDRYLSENRESQDMSNLPKEPAPQSQPQPEEPKKFGLVWKRSIKEDYDELHLRVEALKSAWVKKFSERRKKGLLNQIKSDNTDDSFFDFDLDSDEDVEDQKVSATKGDISQAPSVENANVSEDNLKPEDMVIANSEITNEVPVICEAPLQIATPFFCDSAVFIASSSTIFSKESIIDQDLFFNNEAATSESTVSEALTIHEVKEKYLKLDVNKENQQSIEASPNSTPKSNETISSPDRKFYKNKRKRLRRNTRQNSLRKSVGDVDDEKTLREKALMSLHKRANTKPQKASPISEDSRNKDSTPADGNTISAIPGFDTGVKSDSWEDEIDEDILRAKLLSSLTKQVTTKMTQPTPSNPPLQVAPPNQPPIIPKPQTFKNLHVNKEIRENQKVVNKKVWKKSGLQPDVKAVSKPRIAQPVLTKSNETLAAQQAQAPVQTVDPNEPSVPQVAKMIISLADSDSSSDLDLASEDEKSDEVDRPVHQKNVPPPDIEADIDRLLLEARNSNIEKLAANALIQPSETEVKASICTQKSNEEKKPPRSNVATAVTDTTKSTPQALKHLPAWQQEEYRRLKMKIAEKEKVLQEVSRLKGAELERKPFTEGQKSIGLAEVTSNEKVEVVAVASGTSEAKSGQPESSKEVLDKKENISLPSSKGCSDEGSSGRDKKPCPNLASCSVMEEISVLSDIVNQFDKSSSELNGLKSKKEHLEKLLRQIDAKMALKKKKLNSMKDEIQIKDRNISSRIDSLTIPQQSTENRPASRDMELINLKYKEVSLRAKFLFHGFMTAWNGRGEERAPAAREGLLMGVKRPMEPPKSLATSGKKIHSEALHDKAKESTDLHAKRSFSGKERERGGDWDPNTPVCYFDLNGICKDPECKYQHFKTV